MVVYGVGRLTCVIVWVSPKIRLHLRVLHGSDFTYMYFTDQTLQHLCVTAVARQRPRSFCQNCKLNTHTPLTHTPKSEWADYAAVQA